VERWHGTFMPKHSNSGDQARHEIERIDGDLHTLLIRRSALGAVRDREAPPTEGHWVPARHPAETAEVLRGILSRHQGSLPRRALVGIWSDILFAADTETTLHVYAAENAEGYWDLARTHFGGMIPMVTHSSAIAVVHACADDATALGIVPPPESVEDRKAWWDELAPVGRPGPRFVHSLPFVADENSRTALPRGYAIGTIEQRPTGADTTILRLECHSELSRTRLQTLLRQAGFDAQIIAASRESIRSSASRVLVANSGFVAPDDARLASFVVKAGDAIDRVSLIGGFANPVSGDANRAGP
jgi:hypothetical protein